MRKIILVGFSLQSVEGLKAMSQWEQKREISPVVPTGLPPLPGGQRTPG